MTLYSGNQMADGAHLPSCSVSGTTITSCRIGTNVHWQMDRLRARPAPAARPVFAYTWSRPTNATIATGCKVETSNVMWVSEDFQGHTANCMCTSGRSSRLLQAMCRAEDWN